MTEPGAYNPGMRDNILAFFAFLAFSFVVWLIGQAIDHFRGPEIDGPYVDMNLLARRWRTPLVGQPSGPTRASQLLRLPITWPLWHRIETT